MFKEEEKVDNKQALLKDYEPDEFWGMGQPEEEVKEVKEFKEVKEISKIFSEIPQPEKGKRPKKH